MKKEIIHIYCHYAQQPPYNTMLRYHNWGKELVERGYEVYIIAASVVHNTSIDVIDEIKSNSSIVDGVKYEYIKTPKYTGNGLGRVKNMLKYCLGIKKATKKLPKPTKTICTDAYLYPFVKRAVKKCKIIFDITDLWPLSIVQYAEVSEKNIIIRYLYHLEKKAYIKSDAIVFSMEGGKDYLQERKYAKKIDFNKVFHINMGIDIKAVDKYRLENKVDIPWDETMFNIGYCGSIRKANNVIQICDVAKKIQELEYSDVQFQIYGNGDELDELIEYCKKEKINNIHFYGRIAKENIPYVLSKTKANILTYKQVQLMNYGGSQSKLFDYLSVGKPIICNAKFGYSLITRYNCGLETENQDVDSFVKTIETMHKMSPDELNEMGKRGRMCAEKYDQPYLVDLVEKIFEYVSE